MSHMDVTTNLEPKIIKKLKKRLLKIVQEQLKPYQTR